MMKQFRHDDTSFRLACGVTMKPQLIEMRAQFSLHDGPICKNYISTGQDNKKTPINTSRQPANP